MDSREALIALNMVNGIGSVKLNRLIGAFKEPEKIFDQKLSMLTSVEGIGRELAKNITCFDDKDLKKEISEAEKKNIRIVTIFDDEYPDTLKNIYDPPPVLYMAGKDIPTADLSIGIVGTRESTDYGEKATRKIVKEMSDSGIIFNVISGMARGIDSIAHLEAIKRGVFTIAVLGFGMNKVFPFERRYIARDIFKNGVVISEFPLNMMGNKQNFPRRNRVISGLSDGILVIEAGEKSGTLITADCALEQGREVFAVPGNIFSEKSKGANWLINQGASPVMCIEDIMQEFGIQTEKKEKITVKAGVSAGKLDAMTPQERAIYDLLSEKMHIDRICDETGLEIKKLSRVLTFMEIKGIVKQLNGKNFVIAN